MTRHIVIAALLLVACSNKDKQAEQRNREQYAKAVEQSNKDLAKIATTEPKKPAAALPLSASKPRVIDGFTPAAQIDVPEDVSVVYHKGAGKPDEDAALIDWHGTYIYITASDGDPASVKKELKGAVEEKSRTGDGWVMTATEDASTTVAVYRKPIHALCKASIAIAAGNVDDVIAICSTLRPRS